MLDEEAETIAHPSLGPDDPICRPVLVERARRKEVDAQVWRRLSSIQSRQTVTMCGIGIMVAFAALEYTGIIGPNRSVWARAMFDGLSYMVGR
jgi:hypothetical protein